MRLNGEICCACKIWLPRPHTPGEQYCDRCKPPLKVVYLAFEKRVSWFVVISDSNSHRRLCKLVFADDDKIVELVRRSGGLTDLESKQALEHGIHTGRGAVILKLTPEQYAKLQRPPKKSVASSPENGRVAPHQRRTS
jgi:hypothetical protein